MSSYELYILTPSWSLHTSSSSHTSCPKPARSSLYCFSDSELSFQERHIYGRAAPVCLHQSADRSSSHATFPRRQHIFVLAHGPPSVSRSSISDPSHNVRMEPSDHSRRSVGQSNVAHYRKLARHEWQTSTLDAACARVQHKYNGRPLHTVRPCRGCSTICVQVSVWHRVLVSIDLS
jgi:hypothetical protein